MKRKSYINQAEKIIRVVRYGINDGQPIGEDDLVSVINHMIFRIVRASRGKRRLKK